ncbi:MAG TPA: KOW motif-containing protein [Blastocatellia bacterium]|nr:KOW motif-containing protein [Blastocatellia bacterium]
MINVGSKVRVATGLYKGKTGVVIKVDSQKWHKGRLTTSGVLYTVVFTDEETVPFEAEMLEEIGTAALKKPTGSLKGNTGGLKKKGTGGLKKS